MNQGEENLYSNIRSKCPLYGTSSSAIIGLAVAKESAKEERTTMTDEEELMQIITDYPEICAPLLKLWRQREAQRGQQDQES